MMQPQSKQLRFSVDEYYKMYEIGVLNFQERAEIIEGELFKKMSIGDLHAAVVDLLNKFFVKNTSDEIRLGVQNPVRLSDFNEPEPDFALSDLTKYDGKRHPRPAEVLLLVEVSDSTLAYDRKIKIPLYAEFNIPEVWLIDLKNNQVRVYSRPHDGEYTIVRVLRGGEMLQSEIVPNLQIEIDTIFQ